MKQNWQQKRNVYMKALLSNGYKSEGYIDELEETVCYTWCNTAQKYLFLGVSHKPQYWLSVSDNDLNRMVIALKTNI